MVLEGEMTTLEQRVFAAAFAASHVAHSHGMVTKPVER
jgi:hypothetical protein